MSRPITNGKQDPQSNESTADPNSDLIEQAEALKQTLKSAIGQVGDLVTAVKQQKKQGKAVASAIAALRQLDPVE